MNEENLGHLECVLDRLSDRQALDLILVVAGSRPACLIMDPDPNLKRNLEKFCRLAGLHFRVEEDSSEGLGKKGFLISRREDRLEQLENSTGRFYGMSDTHVGSFLGFPEDDVDYFHEKISRGPVEPETRKVKQKMLSKGKISTEEAKISEIVSYVPEPSEEGVNRAMRKGKSYIQDLRKFDDDHDTEICSITLENFLGIPVSFRDPYTS